MEVRTEKEKQEVIGYMLDNSVIEEKLQSWKQQVQNPVLLKELMEVLAERAAADGGLIVSVKSSEVPAGAENIEIFQSDKRGDINIVKGKGKMRLAMAFTSREKFKRCNDTSGFVMFIDDLFEYLKKSRQVEGIILNFGEEDAVITKDIMKAVLEIRKEMERG